MADSIIIKSGALDGLEDNRRQMLYNIEGVLSAVENEITTDKCDLLQGLINAVKDKLNNSLTDRESLIPLYVKKSQAEEGL